MSEPAAAEGDGNRSAARTNWNAKLDAETRAILDEDAAVFLHQSLSTPCLDAIVGAEGAELIDVAGRRILDFHGNSVHQVGYGHPRVVAAIKDAIDVLPFSPRRYTNRYAIDLARRLADLAPGDLDKVLFAPSGSAAIGMALKLARYATGRHKTLSMWDSFHGANLDAISVGGEALFQRGAGPLLSGAEHVPPLDLAARFFGHGEAAFDRLADYIDYVLSLQGDVAALIAEPVRWTTVVKPPATFWRQVRASCDRNGTLLVFDEIPSCLGRTGTMFASEQAGCTPDILVIGKGLGGGIMPMAAIIARPELDVVPQAAIGHYTHEKSPVGAAAGLATLGVIEDEGLVARARELERIGLMHLDQIARRHPFLAEGRSAGAMLAIAVEGPTPAETAEAILYAALERGLSFKIGGRNVITLCPPLNIPLGQFDRAFAILDEAVAAQAP